MIPLLLLLPLLPLPLLPRKVPSSRARYLAVCSCNLTMSAISAGIPLDITHTPLHLLVGWYRVPTAAQFTMHEPQNNHVFSRILTLDRTFSKFCRVCLSSASPCTVLVVVVACSVPAYTMYYCICTFDVPYVLLYYWSVVRSSRLLRPAY